MARYPMISFGLAWIMPLVVVVFLVQPRHPGARIFGKASAAGFAFIALYALVLSETDIFGVATMRAPAHHVIEKVSAGGLCPWASRCHIVLFDLL